MYFGKNSDPALSLMLSNIYVPYTHTFSSRSIGLRFHIPFSFQSHHYAKTALLRSPEKLYIATFQDLPFSSFVVANPVKFLIPHLI